MGRGPMKGGGDQKDRILKSGGGTEEEGWDALQNSSDEIEVKESRYESEDSQYLRVGGFDGVVPKVVGTTAIQFNY